MIRIRRFVGRPIPGGWHYPIPKGPEIKGENLRELIDRVTEYRVCNGLPIGDPLVEITAYYALHFPFAVENGDREDSPQPDKLTELIYQWINDLWRNPPKEFAQPDEIERRQKICEACRWRTDRKEDDSKAGDETQRRLFLLAKGSLGPDELGLCKWHGHDNRLACLLPKEKLPIDGIPKECWLGKP